MDRIDHATATPERRFTDGNPAQGEAATVVPADWLNNIQEELVNFIEGAGLTLDGEKQDQLKTGLILSIITKIVKHDEDPAAHGGPHTTLETDYISGAAMTPELLHGATPEVIETPVNKQVFSVMSFPCDVSTNAEWAMPMPENWDRGAIKAKLFWLPGSDAVIGENVQFQLLARAFSDGDNPDVSLTGAKVLNDVVTAKWKVHISVASDLLTVQGNPALGDLIQFRLSRHTSVDNMVSDCRVLGVLIQYTCNKPVVAW